MGYITSAVNRERIKFEVSLSYPLPLEGRIRVKGSENDHFFDGLDDLRRFVDQLKDFQIRG
jgi:hypothetical protein